MTAYLQKLGLDHPWRFLFPTKSPIVWRCEAAKSDHFRPLEYILPAQDDDKLGRSSF